MGLLGAPTYPMLRDATQSALFDILESNCIPYEHNKAENTLLLKETGSRIVFRAVDDFERLRGTNLAWFGLDELTYTQEEAWLRLEGRLRDPRATRLCGFAVWTPKGYDWVHQKFLADPSGAYMAIIAKPFENQFLLDKVPDFYARLKDSYDPKFYEQEVLGSYLNLTGGKVYSSFAREQHVTNLELDPNEPLLWSMDFNVDPMSSVIAQQVGYETRVLDEIVLRNATTVQACEEFARRYPRHGAGLVLFGDASGFHSQTTGYSDYDLVKDYFVTNTTFKVHYCLQRSNPSVRERINLVNAKLLSAGGGVSLQIDGKCVELLKDLEQVAYKENTTQVDKDRDRMRTHLSDALGYLLCQIYGEKGRKNGLRPWRVL